jgi:hypothetical protein
MIKLLLPLLFLFSTAVFAETPMQVQARESFLPGPGADEYKKVHIDPKKDLRNQLGLRSSDSIKSINGTPLTRPDAPMRSQGNMDQPGKYEVMIERMGKLETYHYEVR